MLEFDVRRSPANKTLCLEDRSTADMGRIEQPGWIHFKITPLVQSKAIDQMTCAAKVDWHTHCRRDKERAGMKPQVSCSDDSK